MPALRKPKIFISYSVARDQALADQIVALLGKDKYDFFIPGEQLPVGGKFSSQQILESNTKGVGESDMIIGALNEPGLGVTYELGLGAAAGKPVFLYEHGNWAKSIVENDIFKIFVEAVRERGNSFTEIGEAMKN